MPARILIIEDNPDNLELMRYLLVAHGYTVLTAVDGTGGVDQARAETPDLILCDVQLPDIDGFEVVRRIKQIEALRSRPLLAVTALAMVGDRDRVLAAEFDGYFAKPIEPEGFVQEVESFLDPALRGTDSSDGSAVLTPHVTPDHEGGRLILVVDDHQENLDLATTLLEHSGYRVITARDIHEGLDLARRLAPGLILSDVNMEESGFDFIQAVKSEARLRDIPFVFISSTLTSEEAREKGVELGANRFLFRPIDAGELLAEIETCLRPR